MGSHEAKVIMKEGYGDIMVAFPSSDPTVLNLWVMF
jgi:hypothetical protein